jgi:predicted nucleic acid-binding protein
MIVVDASVWISSLFSKEADHQASIEWLDRVDEEANQIVAPSLFLAEISGAVSRRMNSPAAGEKALREVQTNSSMTIMDVDVKLGTRAALVASSLSLRGADAIYVALAEHMRCTLVTLDLEVIARARNLIDVRLPSDA